jgi:hypothetical protein
MGKKVRFTETLISFIFIIKVSNIHTLLNGKKLKQMTYDIIDLVSGRVLYCDKVVCLTARCDGLKWEIERCDIVRCGTVRCNIVRCDIVRCDILRCATVSCYIVRCATVRCDIARFESYPGHYYTECCLLISLNPWKQIPRQLRRLGYCLIPCPIFHSIGEM